jgi:hypothetical protein
LTPFYHPYARLWLPLHAAGWLLLGGLAARLIGTLEERPVAVVGAGPGPLGIGWLGLCLALALTQRYALASGSRPLPGLFAPTDFQTAEGGLLEQILGPESFPPGAVLRVLGRPTIRFALTLRGRWPVKFYSGLAALLDRAEPGDLLLIDELQLAGESDDTLTRLRTRWEIEREAVERLAPPTLLDHDPRAAFAGEPGYKHDLVRWWLYRARTEGER